jgi:hypothetical protein
LNGVRSSTFSDIVCNDPHVQAVGNRLIIANATHQRKILSGRVGSEGISIVLGIIDDPDTG